MRIALVLVIAIMSTVATTKPVPGTGGGGLVWVRSSSAGIDFAKTETTVAQYRSCVKAKKCEAPGDTTISKLCNWDYADRDDHPVNCVRASHAEAFCLWAGGRLPTEDEWYAEASSGKKRKFPWGDQDVTCDYAVWGDGKRKDGCGRGSTWPVCSKTSGNSVSGLCDMGGNVWEWTSTSEYGDRVVRGGSWVGPPEQIRADFRLTFNPEGRWYTIGFRCVRK